MKLSSPWYSYPGLCIVPAAHLRCVRMENGRHSIRLFQTVYVAEEQHLLQLLLVSKNTSRSTKDWLVVEEQKRKMLRMEGGTFVRDQAKVGEGTRKRNVSFLSSSQEVLVLTGIFHVRSLPRLSLLDLSSNSQRLAFTQLLSS